MRERNGAVWSMGTMATLGLGWKSATGMVGGQVSEDLVNPTRYSHIILREMEIH